MKRLACSVIAFILATVIAEQLLGDVAVYFEMWSVGASSRAELVDDFGLGLLWLLIVLPGSIIVGAISSWVTWIVLKKRAVVTVRTHNPGVQNRSLSPHWDPSQLRCCGPVVASSGLGRPLRSVAATKSGVKCMRVIMNKKVLTFSLFVFVLGVCGYILLGKNGPTEAMQSLPYRKLI